MPLGEPGHQLDGWRILEFIDSAATARSTRSLSRTAAAGALKVLLDYRPDSVPYKRFTREIETVLDLARRPGIIPIWEVHLPKQPRRRDRA